MFDPVHSTYYLVLLLLITFLLSIMHNYLIHLVYNFKLFFIYPSEFN